MILGLDLATTKTGYAILDKNGSLIDYGAFRTQSKEPLERMKEIYLFLRDILNRYKITIIVAEDVAITVKNNLKVGSDLLRLQGLIYALAIEYDVPMVFYMPTAWRSIVGTYDGTREGTKRDVQKQRAVDKANDIYSLGLVYYKNETKENRTGDDMAEAILIALAYIKEVERSEDNANNR